MAGVSVVPALMAAMVTAAKADNGLINANVDVAYGKPIDGGATDYLWLGVDDPDAEWITLAETAREFEDAGIGGDVKETGDIAGLAMSYDGDSSVQTAVEAAYAHIEALFAILRANPNLGLIAVDWTIPGDVGPVMYQAVDQGVEVRIPFSVHFQALI